MKNEIANILRQAADKIAAIAEPVATAALPEIPTNPKTVRREWVASVNRNTGGIFHCQSFDSNYHWEKVTVREVLPGDPTPEQIEALADALWHTLERLKNVQSYKDGKSYVMPTFEAAIEYGEAALAPFRKP